MNVALKEWASLVEALAAGRQIFLLRKGGIVEAKRGFELRHKEFLFFPTFEHQHAQFIRPEYRNLLKSDEEQVRISYLARIAGVFSAPDFNVLQTASHHHIWTELFLRQRYEYRPDLPLSVIVVRVCRLAEPQTVPLRPSYAGCKSWVYLTEEIPAEAFAVLPDEEFEAAQDVLLKDLNIAIAPLHHS